MGQLAEAQLDRIARMLPQEANERSTRDGKLVFACQILIQDAGDVIRPAFKRPLASRYHCPLELSIQATRKAERLERFAQSL